MYSVAHAVAATSAVCRAVGMRVAWVFTECNSRSLSTRSMLATVIWFDDESELHHPKNVLRSMLPGKRVIFKRRRPPTTD